MKNILIFLVVFAFSSSLKADGASYYTVGFTIETTKGQIIKGYSWDVCDSYLSEDSTFMPVYLKRLKDTATKSEYLKRVLTYKEWNEKEVDTLFYAKHRIGYEYSIEDDSAYKDTIYTLIGDTSILLSSIKNIKIDTLIFSHSSSYTSGVWGNLNLSDTTWMKKEPKRKIDAQIDLCYFRIFVHEESQYVNNVIKQIEANQKEYSDIEENQMIDSNEKWNIQEVVVAQLYELLKKLKGRKVVILEGCSC